MGWILLNWVDSYVDLLVQICGEFKDSEILRLGFFASSVGQDADHEQLQSEVRDRYKGG